MESAEVVKIDKRRQELEQWLHSKSGLRGVVPQPMQGDASFRRYFRVPPYVAMDAPPPRENCAPFVAVAAALRDMGLHVPEVIDADIERGFLLLSDLGDQTYLSVLNSQNVGVLYQLALQALSIMQSCKEVPSHPLPQFDADFMWQEWNWHREWFLQKYLHIDDNETERQQLEVCYNVLVQSAVEQPQVFMHRDYHSGNLMVLPDDVGILDFQDAFIGPVTYDLASLLRDCYIDWPVQHVEGWALRYLTLLQRRGQLSMVSEGKFLRWFDLMGLQRHLKALMTFARKKVRDNQAEYLMFIPRTLNYVLTVTAQYKELAPMHAYYSKVSQLCAR